MKKLQFHEWTLPFAVLVISLLSFGLLIPWLGFYWDDWPAVWFLHLFGPSGFANVFAVDRPLLGRLFMLISPIFGVSAFQWQLFGIITRLLCALIFWWVLRGLWPTARSEIIYTVLLFLIYPGFKQQYISVTYSYTWVTMSVLLLSFGTMLWAIRKPRWFWLLYISSWICAALTLFTDEYFFGLEILRVVLIWVVLTETIPSIRNRLLRTGILWLPYLLIVGVFLYWRLVIYHTARGEVQIFKLIAEQRLDYLLQLGKTIIHDVTFSSLVAWAQVFDFKRFTSYGSGPTILYLATILISTIIATFYLSKIQNTPTKGASPTSSHRWAKQAVLVGLFALLLAGVPFWVTDLPIGLDFPWDRFTLAMMFGASLLLSGSIIWITKTSLQRAIIFGVLIGLACGLQMQYSNLYRREWNSVKDFFWQLTWRAPGLQPNSLLLASDLPFTYYSDNSLTAPLNWTYAPNLASTNMPYMLYAIEARLGLGLPDFKVGVPVKQVYRATTFTGSTSQALVLYYLPPGCLEIIDPTYNAHIPQKPKNISDAVPLSNPSLIIPNQNPPAQPPLDIFGSEPKHGWCYYFEKADLARQVGDWTAATSLADQALNLNETLYPVNAPELVPFIEGYAHTGNWDKAQHLSEEAYQLNDRMRVILCEVWSRLEKETPPSTDRDSIISQLRTTIKCGATQ
jgi:hypothetical protein